MNIQLFLSFHSIICSFAFSSHSLVWKCAREFKIFVYTYRHISRIHFKEYIFLFQISIKGIVRNKTTSASTLAHMLVNITSSWMFLFIFTSSWATTTRCHILLHSLSLCCVSFWIFSFHKWKWTRNSRKWIAKGSTFYFIKEISISCKCTWPASLVPYFFFYLTFFRFINSMELLNCIVWYQV